MRFFVSRLVLSPQAKDFPHFHAEAPLRLLVVLLLQKLGLTLHHAFGNVQNRPLRDLFHRSGCGVSLVFGLHTGKEIVPEPFSERLLRRDLRILAEELFEEIQVEVRQNALLDGFDGHRVVHAFARNRAVAVVGLHLELRLRGIAGRLTVQRGTNLAAYILVGEVDVALLGFTLARGIVQNTRGEAHGDDVLIACRPVRRLQAGMLLSDAPRQGVHHLIRDGGVQPLDLNILKDGKLRFWHDFQRKFAGHGLPFSNLIDLYGRVCDHIEIL